MKSAPDNQDLDVIDADTLALLNRHMKPVDVDAARNERLQAKLMQDIETADAAVSLLQTIRAGEGNWIEISPLVEKNVLRSDPESGLESYLLRMHPGAHVAAHQHDYDELCLVLEGSLSFGDDIHLAAGDYHLALRGSRHGDAHSTGGALLFLQAAALAGDS